MVSQAQRRKCGKEREGETGTDVVAKPGNKGAPTEKKQSGRENMNFGKIFGSFWLASGASSGIEIRSQAAVRGAGLAWEGTVAAFS